MGLAGLDGLFRLLRKGFCVVRLVLGRRLGGNRGIDERALLRRFQVCGRIKGVVIRVDNFINCFELCLLWRNFRYCIFMVV
jgi:hypothetical protein